MNEILLRKGGMNPFNPRGSPPGGLPYYHPLFEKMTCITHSGRCVAFCRRLGLRVDAESEHAGFDSSEHSENACDQ